MTHSGNSSLLYLWEYRTLYIGELSEMSTVSQGAASLLVGIEGEFDLTVRGKEKITTRTALMPAGAQVRLEAFGRSIAMCYLDPVGVDFSSLVSLMQYGCEDIFYTCEIENHQIERLLTIKNDEVPPADTYRMLMNDVLPADNRHEIIEKINPKVLDIISIIKKEPLVNHSNDDLAERVGLSKDRLQRLFKSTTGIPIRRYRLWYRLFVAANLMACGYTLTDAALQTGFSDSSHFNHTFRSMLGMKPSFVLQRKDLIKILVGGDVGGLFPVFDQACA